MTAEDSKTKFDEFNEALIPVINSYKDKLKFECILIITRAGMINEFDLIFEDCKNVDRNIMSELYTSVVQCASQFGISEDTVYDDDNNGVVFDYDRRYYEGMKNGNGVKIV